MEPSVATSEHSPEKSEEAPCILFDLEDEMSRNEVYWVILISLVCTLRDDAALGGHTDTNKANLSFRFS